MTVDRTRMDRYVEWWWVAFAIALFLLVPFDLFTTLIVVTKYGTAVEANPVMRWLLHRGPVAVTVAHVAVSVLVCCLFGAALERIRRAHPSYRRSLVYLVNVWVSTLFVAGVALVANNLLVLL